MAQGEARFGASMPLLSIVLTGRNDGYGGDFLARFFRTLLFNHQQLTSRQIAHEFVFVEWAPPADRPRVCDLVFDALPALDRRVCTWYEVDAAYQAEMSLNPRLAFLEFIAKNVGIRRAHGRFVLTTNCDVFLGRTVLEAFAGGALEPRVIYRAPRYDITLDDPDRPLDFDVLEDPRILDSPPKALKPPFLSGGTGDFLLLDRDSFHEMRGFNEVYRAARFGIDRNFVVKALSSGLTMADLGGPVYHISHEGSYRSTVHAFTTRDQDAHWGNRHWHSRGVTYDNPRSWGLLRAPVRYVEEGRWRLEFSWDAVPPLVDLKRIVLPPSRVGGPVPGRYVSRS